MNRVAAVAVQAISGPARRSLSTSAPRMQEQVDLSKIKKLQKKFQIDDGVPVHLKGGFTDKVLFGTTIALVIYGLGYSTTVIYALAVPPQN